MKEEKKEKQLGFFDFLIITAVWAAAVGIIFLTKDGVVAIACIVACYHLSKWIILKEES